MTGVTGGGRFDFDDGGTYCGGWEDGKAHGHGVCTGPKGMGEFCGAWQYGFEISGVYTWPSGNQFEGQWMQGKRHGLGIEKKGWWVYKGEWTQGFKGRYGGRASQSTGAKYEGTWTTGLQDGYGVETYADGGQFQGQWLRGIRHGYGVRQSVPYGLASHYRPKALRASLTSLRSEQEDDNVVKQRDRKLDESRGGFVLKARSDESPTQRRRSIFDKQGRSSLRKTLMSGLKLRKQKSTGDINDSPRRPTGSVRSTISNISHTSVDSTQSGMTNTSMYTDSNLSFISQDDINDVNVTETYMGEWKNDKRAGFGVSERSDGLKYEGEWYNNKKFGYGVTTFKDGTKEEGKYKNNVLISSGKRNKLFLIRSSKLRERVDNAVTASQRAAQIALQKADIAISRMANARAKAEQAEMASVKAHEDSDLARLSGKQYAPEFHQPGTDIMKKKLKKDKLEKGEGSKVVGTDILKKQLQEGGQSESNHLKPVMNHHPNHRSQSLVIKRTESPLTDDEGQPRVTPMSALVSAALDCAIAGSSSHLGHSLNKLGDSEIRRPNGFGKGDDRLDGGLETVRKSPRSSPYFPHRRNGEDSNNKQRLSEMLNSTLLHDHFDQYKNLRDDSGLGRDLGILEERGQSPMSGDNYTSDRSPDSGLSDSDPSNRPSHSLQRRKSLPSIVKRDVPVAKTSAKVKETVHSTENLTKEESELFVIENGIRKRVKAEVHKIPEKFTGKNDAVTLPSRYKLEGQGKLSKGAKQGSLPDISDCAELKKTKTMSRREVHKLGDKRREELRLLREEEERRKEGEIVLRLTDVKDWCQQQQLLMVVIAINVGLASMFFNLMQ